MCGLFGIINRKKRAFDYSTFSVLGVNNDSRGGDSCGIFIDGEYEYGVRDNKLFQDFFTESKILKNKKESTIAVGHCRKASVGAINERTAQPVVLKDKSGRIRFVVLHNGTIYNYKELAQKYIPNIKIDDMTDSQVMARIFYYKGYDVLSEYNGGSVFVIIDYRVDSPKCLFFKGISKRTEYSVKPEEERPLYMTFDDSEDEIVFSSIGKYLDALRRGQKVYTIDGNHLMSYTAEDGLVDLGVYSRDKAIQTKPYKATYYSGGGVPTVGFNGVGTTAFGNTHVYNGYYDSDGVYHQSNYIRAMENFTYQLRGVPMNGKYNLTIYGRVIPEADLGKDKNCTTHSVWFYNGIPLLNKRCWKYITHEEEVSVQRKKTCASVKDFLIKNCYLIRYLSLEPFYIDDKNIVHQVVEGSKTVPFTGHIQRLGEGFSKSYRDGSLVTTCYGQQYSKPFKAVEANQQFTKSEIATLVARLFKG
jgi:hypothetical protein